jgi:hypothetical protein
MKTRIILFDPHRKSLLKPFVPIRRYIQMQFNSAMEQLNNALAEGLECDMLLKPTNGESEPVVVVSGFFDIDADYSGSRVIPHKWYNKKVLDNLKIKYC